MRRAEAPKVDQSRANLIFRLVSDLTASEATHMLTAVTGAKCVNVNTVDGQKVEIVACSLAELTALVRSAPGLTLAGSSLHFFEAGCEDELNEARFANLETDEPLFVAISEGVMHDRFEADCFESQGFWQKASAVTKAEFQQTVQHTPKCMALSAGSGDRDGLVHVFENRLRPTEIHVSMLTSSVNSQSAVFFATHGSPGDPKDAYTESTHGNRTFGCIFRFDSCGHMTWWDGSMHKVYEYYFSST
jgi:hypothetical protein